MEDEDEDVRIDDAIALAPEPETEAVIVELSEDLVPDAASEEELVAGAAIGGGDAFFDSDFTDLKLELEQEFASGHNVPTAAVPPLLREPSRGTQVRPVELPEQIGLSAVEWPLRSDGRHAALRAAAAVAGDRQAARPEPHAIVQTATEALPPVSGPPHRPANSDDPRMRDFREAILRDSDRVPAPPAEPLLSSRSGDLVSASFEELDRAIREGQLRSMEDMAEEMMRPMLQEWLDDNLPRIVERLVREEIERVARGGR